MSKLVENMVAAGFHRLYGGWSKCFWALCR